MRGEVLERMEALASVADVETTIERRHRLTEREVSPGPRVRAREVPGEKPVSRPLTEAPKGDEARFHLLVGQLREVVEVELGAREPSDVLRLAPRQPNATELVLR